MTKKIKMNEEVYIGNSNVQVKDLLGAILFENDNGSTNIILTDDYKNYDLLEISFVNNDAYGQITKLDVNNLISKGRFVLNNITPTSSAVYMKQSVFTINEKSISLDDSRYNEIGIDSSGTVKFQNINNILITKVIGYKY